MVRDLKDIDYLPRKPPEVHLNLTTHLSTTLSRPRPSTLSVYIYLFLTCKLPLLSFLHHLSAFWFRSSVVSVLTSLISDMASTGVHQIIPIIPILQSRILASVLAYARVCSATGLTLTLVDANPFFHHSFGLSECLEKRIVLCPHMYYLVVLAHQGRLSLL